MTDKRFNLRGYIILSNLLKSSDELLAAAAASRQAVIDNPQGNIEPRLRELEVLTELIRPLYEQAGHRYQYHLQQVQLSDLRSLVESSAIIGDYVNVTYSTKQIRKLASEISFSSIVTTRHDEGGVAWQQDAEINTRIQLGGLSQVQKVVYEELNGDLTAEAMIITLQRMGYSVIRTAVDSVHLKDGTLIINDEHTHIFKSTGIDGRFIGLFFNGPETLKKKRFQLGDIIDRLENEDYPNPNRDQLRSLQKRYSQAKERINIKIKATTGIDEFICYENKEFFINPRLLK